MKPIAIGDLILVEVLQGFRQEKDVATARQLFRSLAPLSMLGAHHALKAAENDRELGRRGITAAKTIDGIIATACLSMLACSRAPGASPRASRSGLGRVSWPLEVSVTVVLRSQ